MLETIEFDIKAVTELVLVLAILLVSVPLIRELRNGRWKFADWGPADRNVMRTGRIIVWGGAALAWAAVLATMVHRPGLIRESALVDIVFMPLMLAFIAAIWSNSKVLENLHRSRNFRMLISGETAVVVFGLAASFLTLFNAWMAGV
jgi:hypothetical protein